MLCESEHVAAVNGSRWARCANEPVQDKKQTEEQLQIDNDREDSVTRGEKCALQSSKDEVDQNEDRSWQKRRTV